MSGDCPRPLQTAQRQNTPQSPPEMTSALPQRSPCTCLWRVPGRSNSRYKKKHFKKSDSFYRFWVENVKHRKDWKIYFKISLYKKTQKQRKKAQTGGEYLLYWQRDNIQNTYRFWQTHKRPANWIAMTTKIGGKDLNRQFARTEPHVLTGVWDDGSPH